MKQYKFLLFDWDGTLLNSLPVWIHAYKKLFKRYGVVASSDDIRSKAYGNPEGCVNFGIADYENFNKQLFELVQVSYFKAGMFRGALNILSNLKENRYKLALITNTPSSLIQSYLKKNNSPDFYDAIITREDVNALKPDPEGYKKALAQLGVAKRQYKAVLVIGDGIQDMVAGNKLGLDCAFFAPKKMKEHSNIDCNYIIKSLAQLKAIVNAN